MQLFHTIEGIRDALGSERRAGRCIGFVPTMGNLHDGHLALVTQAKASCDVVVCSIFVNPMQFGKNEDLDKYPRTPEADMDKLRSVACDYLFHPVVREMYPNGLDGQTRVACPVMTNVLCGASRPGHFDGVTTVVTKLFNIVQPDVAIFGLKDYQQLAVIRRMVEDLCMPVEIVAAPIQREADGLAMSSRNSYITADERPLAVQLNRTLQWIATQIRKGRRDFSALESEGKQQIASAGFRVDYLVVCNSRSLDPAAIDDSEVTVLGAMYTSGARLIDNVSLSIATRGDADVD